MVREKLKDRILKFFVTQKFRFDMAVQFMVFINFALLVITASPQVNSFLESVGISFHKYLLIGLMVLGSFFGVWLFGFFLDKAEYWSKIRAVQTYRNPIFVKILENTEELRKEVEWLKNQHTKN